MLSRLVTKVRTKYIDWFFGKPDLAKTFAAIALEIATDRDRVFVQIGAGAGDCDPRANYRDGFTEFVKSFVLTATDKVILVEPNPLNLENLTLCWSRFPQAIIKNIGIVPSKLSGGKAKFYFASADAPHFQVGSFVPEHVLQHYPDIESCELQTVLVETVDLTSFIQLTVGSSEISVLSLDIEGFDADIILGTDFDSLRVKYLSFEYIHLGKKASKVVKHLEKFGFVRLGYGIDYQGYDWLFRKQT